LSVISSHKDTALLQKTKYSEQIVWCIFMLFWLIEDCLSQSSFTFIIYETTS